MKKTITKKAMPKAKLGIAVNDKIKTKTRNTLSGGTRTKTVNNDTEMVNIVKKDRAGNVIKNVTRPKFIRSIPEGTDDWGDEGPGSAMKRGGSVKAKKFAALAPPYNKATAADRIAGAKKRAGKKK
jgi:hypothetical protein